MEDRALAAGGLTERDMRLLLALAAAPLAPANEAGRAVYGSRAAARRRIGRLRALGLVEAVQVDRRSIPAPAGERRSGALLALTPEGAEVARALGGIPPTRAQLLEAAALAPAAAAMAQAHLALLPDVEDGRVAWAPRPGLPARGGAEPPEGAWALVEGPGGAAVVDPDRPGRSPRQVQERWERWARWRKAELLVYVAPGPAARRQRLLALPRPAWVRLGHPARELRALLRAEGEGGMAV